MVKKALKGARLSDIGVGTALSSHRARKISAYEIFT